MREPLISLFFTYVAMRAIRSWSLYCKEWQDNLITVTHIKEQWEQFPHGRVGNLLICSFALRSFAQNPSFWRVTMSNLLMSLCPKEQCEWFACDFSRLLTKKRAIPLKTEKCVFLVCFSPFYVQEWIDPVNFCSFPLCFKLTWVIPFCRSLQKSDHEWFAQVAHVKRAKMSDCLGC